MKKSYRYNKYDDKWSTLAVLSNVVWFKVWYRVLIIQHAYYVELKFWLEIEKYISAEIYLDLFFP